MLVQIRGLINEVGCGVVLLFSKIFFQAYCQELFFKNLPFRKFPAIR